MKMIAVFDAKPGPANAPHKVPCKVSQQLFLRGQLPNASTQSDNARAGPDYRWDARWNVQVKPWLVE